MKSKLLMLSLAIALLTQTACITRSLWESQTFYPAEPSNLRLFESHDPEDLLVLYDEQRGTTEHRHARAFFLFANQPRLLNGARPDFVKPSPAGNLAAIAVCTNMDGSSDGIPMAGWFALATNDEAFTLYRDGTNHGTFDLPVYDAVPHKFGRALLTPVTVGLDVGLSALHTIEHEKPIRRAPPSHR